MIYMSMYTVISRKGFLGQIDWELSEKHNMHNTRNVAKTGNGARGQQIFETKTRALGGKKMGGNKIGRNVKQSVMQGIRKQKQKANLQKDRLREQKELLCLERTSSFLKTAKKKSNRMCVYSRKLLVYQRKQNHCEDRH